MQKYANLLSYMQKNSMQNEKKNSMQEEFLIFQII